LLDTSAEGAARLPADDFCSGADGDTLHACINAREEHCPISLDFLQFLLGTAASLCHIALRPVGGASLRSAIVPSECGIPYMSEN
jgi:hypothetical protein